MRLSNFAGGVLPFVLLAACASDGNDGTSCTLTNTDGTTHLECEDGTSVALPDSNPEGCSVGTEAGATVITCGDGTRVELPNASSCSVSENSDGSVSLTCDDGTSTTLREAPATPPGAAVLEVLSGVVSVGSNDGVGTESRMDGALHAAFSPDGNFLYFVDSFNGTLRRFGLRSQRVVTIAGEPGAEGVTDGTGPAARFENPRGIAIDPSGRTLYVADGFNCTIRTVDTESFEVRTLLGVPMNCGYVDGDFDEARMGLVIGMAMRDDRYVYLAQRANGANAIRRIDLDEERMETIAGGAMRGHRDGLGSEALFSGPGGIDFDESGEWLWVNDTFNNVVRRISLTEMDMDGEPTFRVETVAGQPSMRGHVDGIGTEARFSVSQGLTRGIDGFYVAGFHGTVRRVAPEAPFEVETVAGRNGESGSADGHPNEARFGVAFGIHAHPDGERLYYMDRGNNNIREIQLRVNRVRTVMGAPQPTGWRDGNDARFDQPTGVAVSEDGEHAYIADRYNHALRHLNLQTGEVTTLAGLPGEAGYRDAVADGALLDEPIAVVLSPDESALWISEWGNHAIRSLDLSTLTVSTLTGGPERAVEGELPDGGSLDGAVADVLWGHITGLVHDAEANRLYVSDYTLDRIRTIDLEAGAVASLAGGAAIPQVPVLDDDGNPVLDEDGNPETENAREYEPNGVGEDAIFVGPYGLALSADGTTLFVADRAHHLVRRIDVASGTVNTLAGEYGIPGAFDDVGTAAGFDGPTSVSLSDDGERLFVVDTSNHAVRRIDIAARAVDTIVGDLGISGGSGIARTPLDEARLYYPSFAFVAGDDVFLTGENVVYRAHGAATAP